MKQAFSVIIPTMANPVGESSLAENLVESLLALGMPNMEIVLVADVKRQSIPVITRIKSRGPEIVKVIEFHEKFNFSKKCNLGAHSAQSDILIFLNDDVVIDSRTNFQQLVDQAKQVNVGAVGCVLTYPDGSIQHAGITLESKKPRNALSGKPLSELNQLGASPYEVSAVTGACLAISRTKFESIGGWDEDLPNSYNDIDLCLTLRNSGYRNFVDPRVNLMHLEAQSRNESFDIRAFEKLWLKHRNTLGIERFLSVEIGKTAEPTSLLQQLRGLGLVGSFWALYYRLSGRSAKLLGD